MMFFLLRGKVAFDVGSCHDSRTILISKLLPACSTSSAIAGAKKVVKGYHERFSHLTDYGLNVGLYISGDSMGKMIGKKIWETRWEDAQVYVPPRPAIPAKKAGFRSKRFK
jgi:hypothetical protein